MPTYEYQAVNPKKCCDYCRNGFDILQKIVDARLSACPKCGAPIQRVLSAPALGRSQSNLHDRAKAAGFHSIKRVDKGTFEKMY